MPTSRRRCLPKAALLVSAVCLAVGLLTPAHAQGDGKDAPAAHGQTGIHVISRSLHTDEAGFEAMARILDLDYVSGLLLYINWSDLEPEPGKAPVEQRLELVKRIRQHAIDRLKGRLVLRLLGLSYDNPKYFPGPYDGTDKTINEYLSLVWEVRDRVPIAFEANRVFSRANAGRPPYAPEQFERILRNGISHQADWLEIKEFDVWDFGKNVPYAPYQEALSKAHDELTGR